MTTDPSDAVREWYAHEAPWGPQGKDAGWADYILIDQGELLDGKDVLNLGCWYPEDEQWLAYLAGDHLTEPDYRQAVREVHRVLRPGGAFVCVFTNRAAMEHYEGWPPGQTEAHGRFGYERGYSLDEMRALLAAGGFRVEREANTHLPRSGFLTRRIG